ncbi:hypothetical protein L596_027133 [Steinernema carpocapsae]|uniref:Uncharacterized protein n=1 Tax=Steinernema carpocapsae TaxID=34508 RepID=A0A4V5ZYD8_STECR|nr:hypothetical protein L596_027133 [Steinernema carpocapsae]
MGSTVTGCIYMSVFCVLAILNTILAVAIRKTKALWTEWNYRIIVHLSIMDLINLVPTFGAGISSLVALGLPHVINQGFTVISLAIPQSVVVLSVTLALNRLIVIRKQELLNTPKFYKVMIAVSYICGFFWLTVYGLTTMDVSFGFDQEHQNFSVTTDNLKTVKWFIGASFIELNLCKLYLLCGLICCGIVAFTLGRQALSAGGTSQPTVVGPGTFFCSLLPFLYLLLERNSQWYDNLLTFYFWQ